MEIEKKICIWSRSWDIGAVPNLLKNRRKLFVRSNRSCLKMTCDRATWVWCLFKFIWYNQNPSLLFHCIAICPLWILYDNAFAILILFSLISSNSLIFSSRHCFFLAKNKKWLEMAPSCWQRRPARRHWQEVQGWRSFHTWRWSNTEPGGGFWWKEVLLAEEMYFSIKLEFVVPLPPFFCLVCNQDL